MSGFLVSILTMGFLGIFFAWGLAVAQRKLKVEEDPRIERIEKVLPGVNCGGCGFPGCRAFAEAVVNSKAEAEGCPVGGMETAREVAGIIGVEIKKLEKRVAVLLCRGTAQAAKRKADYRGIKTCYAGSLIQKGNKLCSYGCLGFGDCVLVCDFDALIMGNEDLPIVNREKCTGCGMCVRACPKNLFELHPVSRKFFVFCKSHDDAKNSRNHCKNACIACKFCTRGAGKGEIVMENSLSVIKDPSVYDKPEAREWILKCPTKIIGFLEE